MKLSFCSNAYTGRPLEDAIEAVAGHGYRGIEILCDRPHYWPPEEPAARAAGLGHALAAAGIAASNINANTAIGFYRESISENVFGPSLASPDPAKRELRLNHARAAIELAGRIGATSVSLTGGAVGDDHPPQAARLQLVESLQTLLDHAQPLGIRIGLEAEPGLLLERSAEVAAIIDEMGHPLLGFNLDIGHAVVMGEDPAAIIDAHADRIWHLHLEDIADGKHFHLIPGMGDVDFAAIAAALRSNRFEGFASVELYPYKRDPDDAAARAFAALHPLFDD